MKTFILIVVAYAVGYATPFLVRTAKNIYHHFADSKNKVNLK